MHTHIHKPMACRKNGIWYPDELKPSLAWSGSRSTVDEAQQLSRMKSGVYFNPFGPASVMSRTKTFTEPLPRSAERLQWSMPLPCVDGIKQCE